MWWRERDQAAVEVEWSGTAARTMAWAEAGQKLRLRAVMILKVADGRVVQEVDYVILFPDPDPECPRMPLSAEKTAKSCARAVRW